MIRIQWHKCRHTLKTVGPMLPAFKWLLQVTGAEFFIVPKATLEKKNCILQN